jgi:hypothetical protein
MIFAATAFAILTNSFFTPAAGYAAAQNFS